MTTSSTQVNPVNCSCDILSSREVRDSCDTLSSREACELWSVASVSLTWEIGQLWGGLGERGVPLAETGVELL